MPNHALQRTAGVTSVLFGSSFLPPSLSLSSLGVSSRALKTTIYTQVSRAKLGRVLPATFAERLPHDIPEPITAVVFRDQVVTGRVARKAVDQVGSDCGASLVFVARDFTTEASELLALRGIMLIMSSGVWGGYFWSDQSHAEIHTALSTHRPLDTAAKPTPPGNT